MGRSSAGEANLTDRPNAPSNGAASWFRVLNDQIVALVGAGRARTEYELVCECGDASCMRVLRIGPDEYADLRSHDDRFAVLAGHERADVETVVERTPGYLVVERPSASGADAAREELVRSLEALDEDAAPEPARRASFGTDSWLRRSNGFRVIGVDREGSVEGVRAGSGRVEGLIVRFDRELVFIRAARVRAVDPEQRLVVLDDMPALPEGAP